MGPTLQSMGFKIACVDDSLVKIINRNKIMRCEMIRKTIFREKLLAKMKIDPGPKLSENVETDDQLWIHLKK